ncbi:MAG: PIN domain nuclease [Rhodobacteraceae bacterium CG17_big_fil_post_rev_8_21_14_2_50_63_15]|nr:MAG: PIN domain nuclease [Rhodobacteraceae bacterium CG17_big_fil_post_rev_8_21_14_2_50_63_15]
MEAEGGSPAVLGPPFLERCADPMLAARLRNRLQLAIDAMIDQDFQSRVLSFDSLAAKAYAEIAARRRASGRPIAEADCQIAAIARATDAPIATRNVKDFDGCGVRVINPWNAD